MERILVRQLTVGLTLSAFSNAAGKREIPELFGLLTAYHLALRDAPEIGIAREQLRAERQVADRRRFHLLPSLSLSTEYGRVKRRSEGILGLINAYNNHYPGEVNPARLSQPFSNLKTCQAGKARTKSLRAHFRASLQNFRLRVIDTFFEVLRSQTNFRTRKAEGAHFSARESLDDARFDLVIALAHPDRLNSSLDKARLTRFNSWLGKS